MHIVKKKVQGNGTKWNKNIEWYRVIYVLSDFRVALIV